MADASLEPLPPLESERDQALARLQQAFAAGHLTYEELDARLQSVLTARTQDAVRQAVATLPDPDRGRAVNIVAMNGRIRRRGPWRVPRTMRIESENGSVSLDFTQAIFEAPTLDLELQLRFGRARLVVPAGAEVEVDDLQSVWKQPRLRAPGQGAADGPLIRVSGFMEYGRLTVRHRRR